MPAEAEEAAPKAEEPKKEDEPKEEKKKEIDISADLGL